MKLTANKLTVWKYSDNYKVYTENKIIAKKISKYIKAEPACIYEEMGRVIAWDFIVPASKIAAVKKIK